MIRHLTASLATLAMLVSGCTHVPTAKDRDFARIQYDLAIQATKEGRIQEAVGELEEAISRNPEFPEAYNAVGLLYHLSLGRLAKAEKAYKQAIKLKPKFSEAWNNLGALYLEEHHYEQAEKCFRTALDNVLYPTPYLARGNLGWALHEQGRDAEAVTELKSAVLTQPKFCQGYRNLGLIYLANKKTAAATESFKKFVQHCPKQPEAQYEWGRVRRRAGDTEGAREAFTQCAKLAGDKPLGQKCTKALDDLGAGGSTGSGATTTVAPHGAGAGGQ